jgi:hypothetical protein
MPDARPIQLDDAVDIKNGQDAARQQMLDVCRKALPGWEQLAVADVQASPSAVACCLQHLHIHHPSEMSAEAYCYLLSMCYSSPLSVAVSAM